MNVQYQHVTDDIATEIRGIIGEANVIFRDPDRLETYSHDEVAEPEYAHLPELVALPACTR